jgi:hypothetical protein
VNVAVDTAIVGAKELNIGKDFELAIIVNVVQSHEAAAVVVAGVVILVHIVDEIIVRRESSERGGAHARRVAHLVIVANPNHPVARLDIVALKDGAIHGVVYHSLLCCRIVAADANQDERRGTGWRRRWRRRRRGRRRRGAGGRRRGRRAWRRRRGRRRRGRD